MKEHRRCALGFPKTHPRPMVTNPEVPAFTKGPYTIACLHIAPHATVRCPVPFRRPRAIESASGSLQSRGCPHRRSSILSLFTEFSRLPPPDAVVRMHHSDASAVSVAWGPLPPLPVLCPRCRPRSREDRPPHPPGRKTEAGRPGSAPTGGTPDHPPKPWVTWAARTLCAETGRSASCCNPCLHGPAAA